jgi:hypothetical protein
MLDSRVPVAHRSVARIAADPVAVWPGPMLGMGSASIDSSAAYLRFRADVSSSRYGRFRSTAWWSRRDCQNGGSSSRSSSARTSETAGDVSTEDPAAVAYNSLNASLY